MAVMMWRSRSRINYSAGSGNGDAPGLLPEVPLPPHIMKEQAKKSVKAELRDPQKLGLLRHGFRQKLAAYYEKLPGRDS